MLNIVNVRTPQINYLLSSFTAATVENVRRIIIYSPNRSRAIANYTVESMCRFFTWYNDKYHNRITEDSYFFQMILSKPM